MTLACEQTSRVSLLLVPLPCDFTELSSPATGLCPTPELSLGILAPLRRTQDFPHAYSRGFWTEYEQAFDYEEEFGPDKQDSEGIGLYLLNPIQSPGTARGLQTTI